MIPVGLAGLILAAVPPPARAQIRVPAGRGLVQLEAKEQRREGSTFFADGDVDIHYEKLRLRADHVEYNSTTSEARATGHVRFDSEAQTIEGAEGRFNMRSGRGTFTAARGTVRAVRLSNRNVLVSQNPFTFEAQKIERLDARTYVIHHAWVTVCKPDHSLWKFYTARATVNIERSARLAGASFRLLGVPVLYLPYATVPLSKRLRQSGFLVPEVGNSTRRGFVLGDSFYWAPVPWADGTVGLQLFSRRGWSQNIEVRAHPADDVRAWYSFYGVNDRGLPGPGGVRQPQGGHESHFGLDAQLSGGWRAVADLNTLTSLTFRLAFAETFAEAVNSEVRSTAFATNNFRGFSLNFYASRYKNFLTLSPETAVVLRAAPGVRFGSVDQAPWRSWPVYFGFDVYADGANRSDPLLQTAALVQRAEVAPRVTIPLRWGPWLGVTPTFAVRVTRYGEHLVSGTVLADSVRRTTGEVTVDLRPPSFAREWTSGDTKWKHVIEPKVVYRYVTGVNDFGEFLRFDENDTLTDTNEVEYSITQRLLRRSDSGSADELLSWRVTQKYYFDPTFGGALVPGQRNVFQALDSLTPFAFADGFRKFSPIVSDLRLAPHPRYDAQFRVDYDPVHSKVDAFGTLLKIKPYRESFLTLAHFSTNTADILQPRSDQVRILGGYGEINRPGVNANLGFSYDVRHDFFQNQTASVSFNGSCCGLAFEFRRLALGPVRSENQFRVALLIANIGTFGNVRRQEKIF
jgi:LPS-assembly protein